MKKRIGLLVAVFSAAVLVSVVLVSAQQPEPSQPRSQQQPQSPPPPPDPLGDAIFPPDMVMQHQRELGLTDDQKTFMRAEINRTTTRFNELQWQLQDAMEALHETMKANSVNEQLALSQLDKVLDNEREMKRAHMELAIRIKNKLTAEQQAKLQSMKPPRGPGHPPGGPDGRGPGGPGQRPPDAPPEPEY